MWGATPGEEQRSGLLRAARAAHELVGLGPRAVLDLPRVADFIARIVVPLTLRDPGALGAAAGEAGFDALLAARLWRGAAHNRGEHELRDAGALRAGLLGLLDAAAVPEPPQRPRPLTLWGMAIDPADLLEALVSPRRPPIPGLGPVNRFSARL
jgi:hypothetical protein